MLSQIKQAVFDYLYLVGMTISILFISILVLAASVLFAPLFIVSFYYINKINKEAFDVKRVLEII